MRRSFLDRYDVNEYIQEINDMLDGWQVAYHLLEGKRMGYVFKEYRHYQEWAFYLSNERKHNDWVIRIETNLYGAKFNLDMRRGFVHIYMGDFYGFRFEEEEPGYYTHYTDKVEDLAKIMSKLLDIEEIK